LNAANGKPLRRPPLQAVDGKKWCGACEQTKPVAAFNRNTSRPDGLHGACRECHRKQVARSAEKRREKAKASPPKAEKEPEPVRVAVIAPDEKRCVRCRQVKDVDAFLDELGTERGTCHRCLGVLRDRGEGAGELAKEEHAARMERIARRVAARKQRIPKLRGRPAPGNKDFAYVRCLVVRAPAVRDDTHLKVHATCGAVVIAGDELDHLEEVHGLAGDAAAMAVTGCFEPIPAAAEGGGMTKTTSGSGSAPGSGGR
jgi:hypothetical protein